MKVFAQHGCPFAVAARKREENLQNVPDAVIPFTASTITQAGIEHIDDFNALVPNRNFQSGEPFPAGQFNLSMRGIGNGQEGWPSVSYIIDGQTQVWRENWRPG